MPPGIIAAMAAEARILVKGRVPPGALLHLPDGTMMVLSGMGAARARSAARTLIEKGANGLASFGMAGGLKKELRPGVLVLPEIVISDDGSIYYANTAWHESLCSRLNGRVEIDKRPLAESAAVMNRAEKKTLGDKTGAAAVDMESASIARVAAEASIPFVAVRCLTDPAEMDIPRVFPAFIDEFGRVRFSKIISGILGNPRILFPLLRLGKHFQSARTTLTTAALHAGANFAFGTAGR